MPRVGETWLTRYGLKVRLISDDARGPYPLVGLIEWSGGCEKAWTFSRDGHNCDPCDDGLDLIERVTGLDRAMTSSGHVYWVNGHG